MDNRSQPIHMIRCWHAASIEGQVERGLGPVQGIDIVSPNFPLF